MNLLRVMPAKGVQMASATTACPPGREFALIERLAARLGDPPGDVVLTGIGDDAAVLAPDLVWTCDLLVEDVHFRRGTTPLDDLGWKALAVNVSDIAAMAAEPVAALVAVAVGPDWTEDDVDQIYAGLAGCATETGCPVVGGDVSRGPALVLSVTALGRAGRPVLRSGARVGDVVAVTGALGGSEAGRLLLEGLAPPAGVDVDHLARRHRRPVPRLAEARALARQAHALLDVSDGVAADARRLAERSGVTVVVDLDRLPLDAGVEAVAAALGRVPGAFTATGGEDYELLVTLDPAAADTLPVPTTVIGRVEPGPARLELRGRGADATLGGWDHLTAPAAST
ncbi:MAG: Thiamine-monophosphate kinase [uncultured Thermoleophilia bacterium]|uniref:Thiamine-monophosphate kinase n=1 Tax=uncultured Thermoleophilia bacterium TaxID=1497501 RepID=A0A6J4TWG4_9ACTN|nr:MAG: Thiamine-monophosphate kinase [uncultured Thermoleophilia bacterium]